jgi:hypothetical protein
MTNVGYLFENGMGLLKSEAQAASWYRKAAEGGNPLAMRLLGSMYERGNGGLKKDKNQALIWYGKAAQLGDSKAQEALRRVNRR